MDAVKHRQTCNHLHCYRHYWKKFQQGICQTQHWKGVSCDRKLSPKWYFWWRWIPVLLCHWQTLQSVIRTSQCTFKLPGLQWRKNISWIYESVPWNNKTSLKLGQEKLGEESTEKAGSKQTHQRRMILKTKELKRVKGSIQKEHLRRKLWRRGWLLLAALMGSLKRFYMQKWLVMIM